MSVMRLPQHRHGGGQVSTHRGILTQPHRHTDMGTVGNIFRIIIIPHLLSLRLTMGSLADWCLVTGRPNVFLVTMWSQCRHYTFTNPHLDLMASV